VTAYEETEHEAVSLVTEPRQWRRGSGRPNKKRRGWGQTSEWRWARWIVYLILVVGAIVFIAPFAWLVSASFQNLSEIFSVSPHWLPHHFTTSGYRQFLNLGHLSTAQRGQGTGDWRWFANSAFVATSVTILQTFFNALAAYVFAKRKFPGRNAIFLVFLATMMVPGQVTLIPNYIIIKHIPLFGGNDIFGNGGHGWLDSYWGLIMPGTVSAFGIFLLRQYMMSIPDELLDAARIDGANEFRIFWRVVLPLCVPALAASAIFTFQAAWEDFLWPLIIISSPGRYTAPLGLALFVVRNQTSWNLLFAGSVISTLPMVLIFAIFQRRFIRGIALTGLKG
jgi:multiple sugar transport system permease protein